MKKLFITAVTAIAFSAATYAADGTKTTITTGEENITYAALNHFTIDYRNAKSPVWVVTANCQKVSFTLNGEQMTAFYNFTGDYLGTTQNVAVTALPEGTQKDIAAKYAGYKVGEVIKYENFDGEAGDASLAYFVDLKSDKSEILVKVTPDERITFFKKVK